MRAYLPVLAIAGLVAAAALAAQPAKADTAVRCGWDGCQRIVCHNDGNRCYRFDDHGRMTGRYQRDYRFERHYSRDGWRGYDREWSERYDDSWGMRPHWHHRYGPPPPFGRHYDVPDRTGGSWRYDCNDAVTRCFVYRDGTPPPPRP